MWFRIALAFIIAVCAVYPVILLGLPIVAVMLLAKADMSRTWWGNKDHPDNGGNFWRTRCGTSFWCAYQWFATRNPAFNYGKYVMGLVSKGQSKRVAGTQDKIGDLYAEGWYYAREGWAWEVYYIRRYKRWPNKCIRFRCGWKIDDKAAGQFCQFCFSPSPWMTYTGA